MAIYQNRVKDCIISFYLANTFKKMKIEKMEMFHVKPRWLFLKVIVFSSYYTVLTEDV
jgi:hypothetical protein